MSRSARVNVVTGATGFIGGVLARALAGRDGSVRGVLHERPPWFDEPVEWVEGEVLDRESMVAAVRGADIVFHLAAEVSIDPGDADAVWETNVTGTRNAVEAALECGVRRLVHFSSIHAYDQSPVHEVLDERRGPGAPVTTYDAAKARAEAEVRRGIERGLDAVILNPTGVIGPYDAQPSYLGQFFLDMSRRAIPALTTGGFDWVDVRDVVAAAMTAGTRGRRGENYILSGQWHSLVGLARMCRAVTGAPMPRLVCPIPVARAWAPVQVAWDRSRGRRPRLTGSALAMLQTSNRHVSSAKARDELGYDPRPTADSVRDACRRFSDRG